MAHEYRFHRNFVFFIVNLRNCTFVCIEAGLNGGWSLKRCLIFINTHFKVRWTLLQWPISFKYLWLKISQIMFSFLYLNFHSSNRFHAHFFAFSLFLTNCLNKIFSIQFPFVKHLSYATFRGLCFLRCDRTTLPSIASMIELNGYVMKRNNDSHLSQRQWMFKTVNLLYSAHFPTRRYKNEIFVGFK